MDKLVGLELFYTFSTLGLHSFHLTLGEKPVKFLHVSYLNLSPKVHLLSRQKAKVLGKVKLGVSSMTLREKS